MAKKNLKIDSNEKEVMIKFINAQSIEDSEKEKRKNNVIIFGIKNSKASTSAEKAKEDSDIINKICGEIKVETSIIKNIRRLNVKSDKNDASPLIITVEEGSKFELIKAAKLRENFL